MVLANDVESQFSSMAVAGITEQLNGVAPELTSVALGLIRTQTRVGRHHAL